MTTFGGAALPREYGDDSECGGAMSGVVQRMGEQEASNNPCRGKETRTQRLELELGHGGQELVSEEHEDHNHGFEEGRRERNQDLTGRAPV